MELLKQYHQEETPSSNGYDLSSNKNYQLGSSLFDSSSQSNPGFSDGLSLHNMIKKEESNNPVIIEEEDSEESIMSNEAHVGNY